MNASEAVYRGREGSGEAQILQGNPGLAQLLRNQQYAQQSGQNMMRMQYQLMQQRNQRDNQLLKSDFSKPGTFQQEESLNEINNVRDLTMKYAKQNPYASRLDIEQAVGEEKSKTHANIARRNEIQAELKNYQQEITKDPNRYDPQALSLLHDHVFSNIDPKTGRMSNKHVSEIDPGMVGHLTSHPSAINPHTAIADAVSPIKQQLEMSDPGKDVNTGLGLVKEGATNKVRFVKEDGTPGISDHLINYVLEKNPAIENKFFWEIAQNNVKAAGGDPRDIELVKDKYDHLRHTNDPSVLRQVYDKTKSDLTEYQRVSKVDKYINLGKFSESQKVAPTPEDYKITRDQVNSVNRAFEKGDVTGVHDLLRNLENKKYNGMYVLKAEPSIETDSKGPDKRRIKLTMKVGSAGGYALKTDENGNVMTNDKGQPIVDYNTPTKSNATETVYLDPRNKSALFDLLKYNHAEKKAKQMGYNDSGLSEAPQEDNGIDEAEQFKLK